MDSEGAGTRIHIVFIHVHVGLQRDGSPCWAWFTLGWLSAVFFFSPSEDKRKQLSSEFPHLEIVMHASISGRFN